MPKPLPFNKEILSILEEAPHGSPHACMLLRIQSLFNFHRTKRSMECYNFPEILHNLHNELASKDGTRKSVGKSQIRNSIRSGCDLASFNNLFLDCDVTFDPGNLCNFAVEMLIQRALLYIRSNSPRRLRDNDICNLQSQVKTLIRQRPLPDLRGFRWKSLVILNWCQSKSLLRLGTKEVR